MRKNLYAQLYVFGSRDEAEVRGQVVTALQCTFDEEFAKSDTYGTITWFSSVFGFEVMFQRQSRQDDGAWYVVNVGPEIDVMDHDAPMEEMNFHLAQVLRAGGFEQIVTLEEYKAHHHRPEPAQADA